MLAATLPAHYKILQRKKCSTEQEIVDLKASLWAIGNTAVTPQGMQQLMGLTNGYLEDSVAVHIVRLTKYSPVYSVRATAFYVLGLIGTTYDGANVLSDLGWLCVRHTRHDQFPVIPEETYLTYDANVHNFITSPDRRFNSYDVDVSEHSDHTDQSVAESLHSDYIKNPNKTSSISTEDQKDQDVVDHKMNFTIENRPDKRKSHTLPTQGCSSSHDRPTLSESRTVDILRDCSNYERPAPHARTENRLLIARMNSLEQAHEGRVRNTSESSTSGVSSCDSFLGKYAIPDRVLTLSPIPSSSSLYGMKSSSSSHRPKIPDLQRRTSTSSFVTQDAASSPPTQMDMTGYATLKSLNKHRRPHHYSESAATGSSELDDLSWLLTDTHRRSKHNFSSLRDRAKSTRERMTKLSLLDYDWKPLSLAEGRQSPPPLPRAPRRAPLPPPAHPGAYIGICLPRDLMELFPREDDDKEEESYKDNSKQNRVPSFMVDSSIASNENKSRATPDSQKFASYRGGDVARSAAMFVASTANRATVPAAREGFSVINLSATTVAGTSGTNVATVSSARAKNVSKPTESSSAGLNTSVKVAIGEASSTENRIDVKAASSEIQQNSDAATQSKSTVSSKTVTSTNTSENKVVTGVDTAPSGASNKTASTTGSNEAGNVSTAASEAGTSSSKTSGPRVNVSTTASDTGTNSSATAGKVNRVGAGDTSAPASEADNSTVASRADRWRHSTADCLACVPTRPPSAHELREAFFAGIDVLEARNATSPMPERSPQAEVLHHVHFMANPIHLRQTRSALLSLKQRHPDVFRSPCVYSDVCALLSRDTYMLCARRFVQELFLDADFDCFTTEPAIVLSRHGSITSPIAVPIPQFDVT